MTSPGIMPSLPTTVGAEVEYTTTTGTYRFTNTAPATWVVHRRGDMQWAGHLSGSGAFYDFFTKGGPVKINAMGASLQQILAKML